MLNLLLNPPNEILLWQVQTKYSNGDYAEILAWTHTKSQLIGLVIERYLLCKSYATQGDVSSWSKSGLGKTQRAESSGRQTWGFFSENVSQQCSLWLCYWILLIVARTPLRVGAIVSDVVPRWEKHWNETLWRGIADFRQCWVDLLTSSHSSGGFSLVGNGSKSL